MGFWVIRSFTFRPSRAWARRVASASALEAMYTKKAMRTRKGLKTVSPKSPRARATAWLRAKACLVAWR